MVLGRAKGYKLARVCVLSLEAFDPSAEIQTLFLFCCFPAFISEHDICVLLMYFFSVLLLLTSWDSLVKPACIIQKQQLERP